MTQDNISDFIIRLKNAGNAGRKTLVAPYSAVNVRIAALLKEKGYIKSQEKVGSKATECIEIELADNEKESDKPKLLNVKRRSKPSKRVYLSVDSIFPVRNGHGMLVLSTSKGVLSGDDAKKENVGGEVLFEIW